MNTYLCLALLVVSAACVNIQTDTPAFTVEGIPVDFTRMVSQRGSGISAEQEVFVNKVMTDAYNAQGNYLYGNAIFIEQKLEDAYGGSWIVDIYSGSGLNWGRGGLSFKNDQWLFYPGWDNGFFYWIWVPGY